jgi:hypothetical protein
LTRPFHHSESAARPAAGKYFSEEELCVFVSSYRLLLTGGIDDKLSPITGAFTRGSHTLCAI